MSNHSPRKQNQRPKKLGELLVEMGETACKLRLATDYIAKGENPGRAYKKRKTTKY